MKNKLFRLSIAGFIFVSIIGTVSHFIYDWSGENSIIGIFTPVNESPWEHLKLIFLPYLIWSIIEFFILKKEKGLLFCKAIGVVSGMAAILAFFYTYTGIVGKNIDTLNILSFFVGILVAFLTDNALIKNKKVSARDYDVIGVIIFVILCIVFNLFTFYPPLIPLFRDPITSTYGI